MDFNFTKGQRLVVELTSKDIFEGDYEAGAKDRIDLLNAAEYPNGNKLKGLQCYYRSEIASVHVLTHESDEDKEACITETIATNKDGHPPKIALRKSEYNRLKDMTQEYIYMATMDKRYLDAASHLNSCESIGVVGLGAELGRMRTLNLLVLSSWDQVYIFDLHLFRKKVFAPELRSILESDCIKKVVHDSRTLTDCLWHCHGIDMKNVFDTQVADLMIVKNQTGIVPDTNRNLSECLLHYLNFPRSLLDRAMKVNIQKWETRPLTDSDKIKAAQLVAYLITLRNKLEEIMLKNFYDAVKEHSQALKNCDSYKARTSLGDNNVSEKLKEFIAKDTFN